MIKGFEEAIKKIKYDIEYGFHCNDLSFGEFEDDLVYIFNKLAKENGHPPIDWEYHEYEPLDDLLDSYDQEQHRAAAEARGCV